MSAGALIGIDGDTLHIRDLLVNDARASHLVRQAGEDGASSAVAAMVRVGAQGLETMIDAQHLDFVRGQVSGLITKTEVAITGLAERLHEEADANFDPAVPGSYSHKIAAEVDRARSEIGQSLALAVSQLKDAEAQLRHDLDSSLNPKVEGSATQATVAVISGMLERVNTDFDPQNQNGHIARLTAALDQYAAAGGPFEARLKQELAETRDGLLAELRAMRDVIVAQQTARVSKPAVIGETFETAVELVLQQAARLSEGDWVENVTRQVGEATDAKTGDFDYHLATGGLIAIEARNRRDRISVGGRGGVIEQLAKTRANRRADFAIYCVADEHALPDQVGYLQRYGDDRIICCFGSDGQILTLAIKFARLCLAYRNESGASVDGEQVRATLEEMQRKISTLGAVRRWCSNITESADKIRAHVATVMIETSELADQAAASSRLTSTEPSAPAEAA